MKPRLYGLLFPLIGCALSVPAITASAIVFFDFNTSPFLQVTNIDPNLGVTNMGISTGTIDTNQSFTSPAAFTGAPYIQSTGGWDASNQATAKEFTFTITADSGFIFDVTRLNVSVLSANSGPATVGLSYGSGSANHGVPGTTSVFTKQQNFTTELVGLSSLVIGIQGWGGGSGDFRIDDVVVSGSVYVVPEPSAYAAIFGLIGFGIALLGRRRRNGRAA